MVYLVGDAGLDSPERDAVLTHLHSELLRHVERHPSVPATVVFLGDNIYDVGARPGFRDEDLAKLSGQVRAIPRAPSVQGVFLPGNHDWGKGAPDEEGRTAIEVQQRWIEEIEGSRNAGFLPADECPGPVTVDVGADVQLVFIDTEWLLRRPEGTACGDPDRFYQRLADELRSLAGEQVIVAAHHPIASGGPHGGNVGLFDEVPIAYFLAAKSGLSVQDLASGRYSDMIDRIEEAVEASGTRPLAFAAGHDHSLQAIHLDGPDHPWYQLVSGSASKRSQAARIEGTRFASSAHGYMRVEFGRGVPRLVVFARSAEDGEVRPVFSCGLGTSPGSSCAEAPRAGEAR